ncbi:putative myb transcription factor [Tieghemostelium lacteum]|uniref:Putative myb transcription factor n=1 Tax=Tieghemostelium lacteum TaxID=361077 RepID=A0A151Z3H2_TIELA|nr:putative myb transcription factor [Tieghemostelium lacteum]|eukprot:KYQ88467.1 putative myb transcription factor [Tieghemostelium lacteum]
MATIVFQNPNPLYYYPTVQQNPNNPNPSVNNTPTTGPVSIATMYPTSTSKIISPSYIPIPYHPYMDSGSIANSGIYYTPNSSSNNLLPMKRLFSDSDEDPTDNQYPTNIYSNVHHNQHLNILLHNQQMQQLHIQQQLNNPNAIQSSPMIHLTNSITNNNTNIPSSPEQRDLSPSLDSPESPIDNYDYSDEDDEELRKALSPFISLIIKNNSTSYLLPIISECTKESITVKHMLSKIKSISQTDSKFDIYFQLLQTLVKLDGDIRMVNYLVENGVDEEDLNFVKDIELTQTSNPESATKKKRERKRESISRGIRSPPNKWTKAESQNLIKLVSENGDRQWKKIAAKLGGGKTGAQCAQHWKRVLSPEIKKGSWDEEEEELLFELVAKHGQSWKNVAMEIKTRTDIQCRYQYFKAVVSRQTSWSVLEDEILQKKVKSLLLVDEKISFQQVAKHLARAKTTKIPRTSLECKLRWNQLVQEQQNPNQQSIPMVSYIEFPNTSEQHSG